MAVKTIEIKGIKYFLFPFVFIDTALTKIYNNNSWHNAEKKFTINSTAVKSQELSQILVNRGTFTEDEKLMIAVSEKEIKWIKEQYEMPF